MMPTNLACLFSVPVYNQPATAEKLLLATRGIDKIVALLNVLTVWKVALIQREFRLEIIRAVIILFSVAIAGCSSFSLPPSEIEQGSTRDEVIAVLGEPDQIQDFILPDVPFFGPQEGLANLVLPGTVIEEWVYEIGDDVVYVWFSGDVDQQREDWLVIDTIPEIFHTGHLHINGLSRYRNVTLINSGCFQAQTDFMRSFGIDPTIGIVPIVELDSLKTSLLDFKKQI